MTDATINPILWSNIKRERDQLTTYRARSDSAALIVDDDAYDPCWKHYSRLHPILYDGMTLHVQGLIRGLLASLI